jgi:hypothetical protein
MHVERKADSSLISSPTLETILLGSLALDIAIAAAYSSSMKITEAKVVDRFHVFVRFNDGVSGVVDLSYLAGRGVFRAWEQKGIFEQLSVSPQGALEWPGELDLCPDSLYLRVVGKSAAQVFPGIHDSAVHA